MIKELWIEENNLTLYESELAEDTDLVAVAGYIRTATDGEGTDQGLRFMR